ncbi:hypothetical protein SO802_026321 [Lithocarpus litseifolius]|uniref:Uncharacterized protein n=1 Tax=Lithocarpus litseifolius TaxID=425828 RepID=A0AAW2BZA5_9ROSI
MEKHEGCLRLAKQMDRSCLAIHHCGFVNLGFVGSPYTWSRNHPEKGRIFIRLDRALATTSWTSLFQGTTVHHLSMSTSNHSMLVVTLPSARHHRPRLKRPFLFEAMWLRDPRCDEVVQEAWMEGLYKPVGSPITNCFNNCKERLETWNKTEFGHVERQITRLEKKLQALEQNP